MCVFLFFSFFFFKISSKLSVVCFPKLLHMICLALDILEFSPKNNRTVFHSQSPKRARFPQSRTLLTLALC